MAIDWTKIYKKYKGLWVALKSDEKTVIASGKTLKETATISKRKGYKDPIFFRVPEKVASYVGLK